MTDSTSFAQPGGLRMETANAVAGMIDGGINVSAIDLEGRGKDFSRVQAELLAGQIASGNGNAEALADSGIPKALAVAIAGAINAKAAA